MNKEPAHCVACKLNIVLKFLKIVFSISVNYCFGCRYKLCNVYLCECGMRMWKFSNMSSLRVGVLVYEIKKARARATTTHAHAYAAAQCCHVD